MPWRRGRGGRPRKLNAKRRATTLAGRRPDRDPGSPERVSRKLLVANGSAVPVELVDVVGVLRANELLVDEEVAQLRTLAGWLKQLAVAFGLRQASPGGLWAAITSGTGLGSIGVTVPAGGDRALFRLGELFHWFAAADQLGMLRLVIRVAAGEVAPENAFELDRPFDINVLLASKAVRDRDLRRPRVGPRRSD